MSDLPAFAANFMGEEPELIGEPPRDTCAVTVLVTTYNHEQFIRRCIEGVLSQRFDQRYHLVIHDDASTDGTAAIVREFAAKYPDRIFAILQRENQYSRGNSQFIGILRSIPTPYVALCEGDDFWTDDAKLERQWSFMQRNVWCAISHHDVEVLAGPENTAYADEIRHHLRLRRPRHERVVGTALTDGNWIITCSVMIRTSCIPADLLREVGAREPNDYLLYSLVTEHGDIGFLPEAMAAYRLHGANLWSSLPFEERSAAEREVLWFLAAHLSGASADRVRARLVGNRIVG